MEPDRLELLRNMPVFGALSDEALEFLNTRCHTVCKAPGELFFTQGDAAGAVYALESGEAEVIKLCKGDSLRQLRLIEQGDSFGEMAVVDMSPRAATIRAITDCQAIRIPTSLLYELYKFDLEQFTLIQMNMLREVTRRLRSLHNKLAEEHPEFLEKVARTHKD